MGLLDNKPQNSPLGLPAQSTIGQSVRLWQPDPAQFELGELFEDEQADAQTVEWDEVHAILGMAQDHEPGTEIPTINQRGITTRKEDPFFIEESGLLKQRDFERARKTSSPLENGGEQLVMRLAEQLTVRRETRKEWMRAQALAVGSITFNGRTVTYGIPGGNKVTLATKWTNYQAANPIEDIQAMMLLFRGVGEGITCRFNLKVAQHLARNEMLRDLFRQSALGLDLGPTGVPKLLSALCGDGQPIEFKIYDKGYKSESDGTYTPFIPNTAFSLVANPPLGQKLGSWTSVPCIANAAEGSFTPRPGPFVIVDNKLRTKHKCYEQTQGEYGMICFKHPSNAAILTVADA